MDDGRKVIYRWANTVGLQIRRAWRYQRSNQNPYIEEEQTTQWPKEKVQKDKQRSTKHTHNKSVATEVIQELAYRWN
jgi:hypothetical protein